MPPENEAGPVGEDKKGKKKLPIKSIIVVLAIILLEGGMLGLYMTLSEPQNADADIIAGEQAPAAPAVGEVTILEDRVSNMRSGRLYFYDVRICIEVEQADVETVEQDVAKREAFIRDSIRTAFAQADPQYLEEPELQTMKRKIHEILEEALGEGRVRAVFIPKYNRYRGQ